MISKRKLSLGTQCITRRIAVKDIPEAVTFLNTENENEKKEFSNFLLELLFTDDKASSAIYNSDAIFYSILTLTQGKDYCSKLQSLVLLLAGTLGVSQNADEMITELSIPILIKVSSETIGKRDKISMQALKSLCGIMQKNNSESTKDTMLRSGIVSLFVQHLTEHESPEAPQVQDGDVIKQQNENVGSEARKLSLEGTLWLCRAGADKELLTDLIEPIKSVAIDPEEVDREQAVRLSIEEEDVFGLQSGLKHGNPIDEDNKLKARAILAKYLEPKKKKSIDLNSEEVDDIDDNDLKDIIFKLANPKSEVVIPALTQLTKYATKFPTLPHLSQLVGIEILHYLYFLVLSPVSELIRQSCFLIKTIVGPQGKSDKFKSKSSSFRMVSDSEQRAIADRQRRTHIGLVIDGHIFEKLLEILRIYFQGVDQQLSNERDEILGIEGITRKRDHSQSPNRSGKTGQQRQSPISKRTNKQNKHSSPQTLQSSSSSSSNQISPLQPLLVRNAATLGIIEAENVMSVVQQMLLGADYQLTSTMVSLGCIETLSMLFQMMVNAIEISGSQTSGDTESETLNSKKDNDYDQDTYQKIAQSSFKVLSIHSYLLKMGCRSIECVSVQGAREAPIYGENQFKEETDNFVVIHKLLSLFRHYSPLSDSSSRINVINTQNPAQKSTSPASKSKSSKKGNNQTGKGIQVVAQYPTGLCPSSNTCTSITQSCANAVFCINGYDLLPKQAEIIIPSLMAKLRLENKELGNELQSTSRNSGGSQNDDNLEADRNSLSTISMLACTALSFLNPTDVEYKVNFIAPHPQLAIADGASIRIIDNNDTTVYIDKIIDSGIWRCDLKLSTGERGQNSVGIFRSSFLIPYSYPLGLDSESVSFDAYRGYCKQRGVTSAYMQKWGQGDIIGIELNMGNRTIHFFVNGELMPVAYRNIPSRVRIAAHFLTSESEGKVISFRRLYRHSIPFTTRCQLIDWNYNIQIERWSAGGAK